MQYRFGLTLKQWQGRCVLCQEGVLSSGFLCELCDEQLCPAKPFRLDGDGLWIKPAYPYAGVIRRAIKAIKDQDNPHALPILVHTLGTLASWLDDKMAQGQLPSEAHILPMPTTNERLGEKGVFLVGLLAQYLSAMTGLPLYEGVVRVKDGVRQRGLGREARIANIHNAFTVNDLPTAPLVIIFDDVITTGATVSEVAKTLLAKDPTLKVLAMCLAHGH